MLSVTMECIFYTLGLTFLFSVTNPAACASDDECSVYFVSLLAFSPNRVWCVGVPETRVFCLFLVGTRGFAAAVVCQSRSPLRLQHIFEFQRNGGIVMIFFLQVLIFY